MNSIKENNNLNLLITSVGRRSYLVEYFKRALNGKGKVFVSNSSPLCPAFSVADEYVISPLIYDEKYIDFILNYCIKNKIKAVISLFDIDLPVLAKNRDKFTNLGIQLIVSDLNAIEICNDKFKTYEFLINNGFSTPKTYIDLKSALKDLEKKHLQFPLVIKPRWGMGSIGVYIAENLEELNVLYNKAKHAIEKSYLKYETADKINEGILIQECINGKEYGLDIINDLNSQYQNTIVKLKYAMRAGETDCAITVNHPELKKIGEKISQILKHVGNLDVDVFVNETAIYILEMNARFGGGYPFTHAAGVDLPKAIICWLNNEAFDKSLLQEKFNIMLQKDIRLIQLDTDTYLKGDNNGK